MIKIKQNNQVELQNFATNVYHNIKIYLKTKGKLFIVGWLFLSIALGLLEITGWVWIALAIMFIDLLPVIGSGMVFVPWALIEMFTGDMQRGWILLGIYVALIILEQVAETIWMGKSMQMPFWIPLAITLTCSLALGPMGILLAALLIPVASTLYQQGKI